MWAFSSRQGRKRSLDSEKLIRGRVPLAKLRTHSERTQDFENVGTLVAHLIGDYPEANYCGLGLARCLFHWRERTLPFVAFWRGSQGEF